MLAEFLDMYLHPVSTYLFKVIITDIMSSFNVIMNYLKVLKQPPEVFYKKGVLKKLAKFTGRHLCQSLFFNKVAGSSLTALSLLLQSSPS